MNKFKLFLKKYLWAYLVVLTCWIGLLIESFKQDSELIKDNPLLLLILAHTTLIGAVIGLSVHMYNRLDH
jgi:hypothetical protein